MVTLQCLVLSMMMQVTASWLGKIAQPKYSYWQNLTSNLSSFRSVLGEGQSYQMLQLHFHWGSDNSRGSEHTINGEEFPMEMHIVHKKVGLTVEEALGTSDGLAVVGQMFQVAF